MTRSHKGWALDSVVLQNHITKLNREDVHEGPAEGVYVYGLFLEGKLTLAPGNLRFPKYREIPVLLRYSQSRYRDYKYSALTWYDRL